jgi:TolA-binding protein
MLRIEVMSLKEKMATLQRKFDVILKGQRSGIYDDVQLPANIQTHLMPAKVNPVPPLVSEGPVDRMDDDSAPVQRQAVLNVENPQQIVDKALILLERREFGRVAQALENFQQRFPNNALSAVAELTLAEAYVELKTPQQALIHVRTFYLQHPNDPLLNRAKWLEAQSHEQLSAPQKAAQLYREVIALNPQAQLALQARTALEKLSAGGAQ